MIVESDETTAEMIAGIDGMTAETNDVGGPDQGVLRSEEFPSIARSLTDRSAVETAEIETENIDDEIDR